MLFDDFKNSLSGDRTKCHNEFNIFRTFFQTFHLSNIGSESEDVDDEIGNGNRDELIRREENQGAETAQAARHDFVREDEAVEAETVKQRAEEDNGIIPHFVFA